MSIVKMKHLRVMTLARDRDELLARLLHFGCVQIEEPDDRLSDPAWAALLKRDTSRLLEAKNKLGAANAALAAVRRYGGVSDGLFIKRGEIKETEFLGSALEEQGGAASEAVNGRLAELARLQSEENQLTARRAALAPWVSLDLPLERTATEYMWVRLAVCPAGTDVAAMQADLAGAEAPAELLEVSADDEQCYLLLLCLKAGEEQVMELLRPYGVSLAGFKDVTGTAAENLAALDQALADNRQRLAALEEELAGLKDQWTELKLYTDRLTQETEKAENAERLLTDGTIVFFEGWVPADALPEVEACLKEKGCAWETADPAPEEYPRVPVQLRNGKLVQPLNMVTEMYSLPAYDGVDPNPLMAPFFILFYGIMMADMGYGLLMMLASLVVLNKYRPKGTMHHFFGLMGLCGVSTFVMGAVTGGFFGDFLTQLVGIVSPGTTFVLPSLFTPLDDTLMILIGAMCLGAVQIVTGMAVSFVEKLKRGQVMDAVWEEVTWWIVFAGAALAFLGVTPLVLIVGGVMVVAGPVLTGTGFGKITGIFGSLYNHVTGYFGDILSYSRLMALMLAGSVIAQVFNTLGAIPGNVIIFFIISMAGNALNFALNLLGCYVHDLRLQCLEYFGKFYKDGGKPFRPLSMKTKFVDIVKE